MQILIIAAVGSVATAWRAGHLVGSGVLCILVTLIVLLQLVRGLLGRRGTDHDSMFCYHMYSSSSDQERGLLC